MSVENRVGGKVIVRSARESEIDPLARVWYDSWQDAHATIVPAELTRLRTLDSFRERLLALLPDVRVAGPVGSPTALCIVKGDELYQLFVAAPARGSGVAAALIADAETRIAQSGAATAWLACAIGNERAARFYEKCGWRRATTFVSPLETPEGRFLLEVWRYEKPLGPALSDSRRLLQHFLAALAYRTQKALRGAPTEFAGFRSGTHVRTPHELVWHMTGVIGYARTMLHGGDFAPPQLATFDAEVARFHEALAALRADFGNPSLTATITDEQFLQGPLSDAMTHAGQLALLRRLAGSPVASENFIFAAIDSGNVSARQAAPAAPDPWWSPDKPPPRPGPGNPYEPST